MIAIRVVFRMGWALPNPVTRMNGDRTGVPFAFLEPATAQTTKKLTLTVTDTPTGDGSGTAIEGATVLIDGAKKLTNASGKVEVNLPAGTYTVKVKADGYKGTTDEVTITTAAVTKTIQLAAK